MKTLCTFLLALSAASLYAQPQQVFDWVKASDEVVQLSPFDFHAGRIYRPGPSGGNMHVLIHAEQPVTIAMAWAHEWSEAQAHPEMLPNLEYRCLQEHITDAIYECHLPSDRPMVLVLHDERGGPNLSMLKAVGGIVGRVASNLIVAPNQAVITYNSWLCVANCAQPEYQWARLVNEKYDISASPKLYNVLTPQYDGQRIWVNIKSDVPMTVALLPSSLADQAYDNPALLSSALSQTTCKQRGVQKMEFECKVSRADGPQALFAFPDIPVRSRKKAQIEFQANNCTANCDLIPSDTVSGN